MYTPFLPTTAKKESNVPKLNPNWHEIWKQEKWSSLAPPRNPDWCQFSPGCFKIFSKKSADKVLSKMDRGWKVPYFMPIRVKCSKSLSVLMYIPCTPPTYLQKEQYLPSALTQPEFYLDYNVMVRIFWHTIQMSRNCNISNNSRGSVSLWLLLMVKPLPFGKFLQMCSL